MENVYDLIIIGSGPAGMAAAIYASRAKLKFLLFEKAFAGGQVINTYEVDNYPGIKNVSGFELSSMIREHVESFDVETKTEEVTELKLTNPIKEVITSNETYQTKTIIFATGAKWRKLGVKGEKELSGMGVSYCATCDGAFYKDKVVAVVGGGDVAVEDAIYLARICKKVYLIHRRDELRAVKVLQERLLQTENIEVLWDTVVEEIAGTEHVTGMKLLNKKTNEKKEIEIDGAFIAVGTTPNSELLKGQVDMDEHNFIITDEDCETSVSGVYAAGDVRKKSLRQIITGAADGAVSVYTAERYLIEN